MILIFDNSLKLFQNMDKANSMMSDLKNSVSIRYVNQQLRQKMMEILEGQVEKEERQICLEYINHIEQTHESLLESITRFAQHYQNIYHEYQNNYDSLQQDNHQLIKTYQDEKKDSSVLLQQYHHKIDQMTKQLMQKEEDIRQLQFKCDEKDLLLDHFEKEQSQTFKKFELEFSKQQKALEESLEFVAKLQQQNSSLRESNSHLSEINNQLKYSNQNIHIEYEKLVFQSQKNIGSSIKSSLSIEGKSEISSDQRNSFEHFGQINDQMCSRQLIEDSQIPPKIQTLKQMLNLSVEKNYQIQYNCNSVESNQKQNIPHNVDPNPSGFKNLCPINQSNEQQISQKTAKINIQQFNLVPSFVSNRQNPYYIFFLLASQNAKIKSKHFEEICLINTEQEWTNILQAKLPLHQWEDYLAKYLHKSARISI